MTNKLITSGLEYWPQAHGDTIQYNVFETPATFDPETMEIAELEGAVYKHNMLISTSLHRSSGFTSFSHHPSMPAAPIDMHFAQVNGLGIYNGNCFFGESVNELGNVIHPPEPKICCHPVVGQSFDVFSMVFQSENDPTIVIENYHTRYKTLRTAPYYGDVIVTAMAELGQNGEFSGWVGNFYFKRAVGIILQYGGVLNSDGRTMNAIKLFKNP
jgi:hypothetical protein